MIVIADTSPLNYLILIGAADLLPALYTNIYTTPACTSELGSPDTPEEVRTWLRSKPDWLVIATPENIGDPRLNHLDLGEREAITLALQLKADLVLIDERDGRMAAQSVRLDRCGYAARSRKCRSSRRHRPGRGFRQAEVYDFPRRSQVD